MEIKNKPSWSINIFGRGQNAIDTSSDSSVGKSQTVSSDSLNRRFPAMRVLVSSIRNLTAGLSSIGSAIKDVAWSTYSKLKVFVAQLSVNSTNFAAIKTLYGKELAANYEAGFLKNGKIQQASTEEIRYNFANLPPQQNTITFLSKGVESLNRIGYHTDSSFPQFSDAVIPSGGFARIYGEKERDVLLDSFLYEPNNNRNAIKSLLEVSAEGKDTLSPPKNKNNVVKSEIEKTLHAAQEDLAVLKATLEKATTDYEKWPSDRLAAFVGLHRLKEGAITKVITAATDLINLQKKTDDDVLAAHSGKLSDATASVTNSKDRLSKANQNHADFTSNQLEERKNQVADAEKDLLQLRQTFPNNAAILKDHQNKIVTAKATLAASQAAALARLNETKDDQVWSVEHTLNYVDQATKEDQQTKIKFDRVRVKIGGKVIPLSGSKGNAYAENFDLFKNSLKELAGKDLPETQVTEMIQLLNSDRLAQGFPSGADMETGLTLGSAQPLSSNEKNVFEIKLVNKGKSNEAFDFHYDSGRSYLTSLQVPVPSNRFKRVSITLNNKPISLGTYPSPEERSVFLKNRMNSISSDNFDAVMAQLENLDPDDPNKTEKAIQDILSDTKLKIAIKSNPSATTSTLSSSLTVKLDGSKLEANNRNEVAPDLLQFVTKKQFVYRYTPPLNNNSKSSVKITDSRQLYLPLTLEVNLP